MKSSTGEFKVKIVRKIGMSALWFVLILATAVATAAVKQRFEDGPNRVFSGGALVSGEIYK
ncbi:MAG: hypothetical protein ACPHHQ_11110, partial [Pseudomonadales bacterium]